jgi:hypothetical protein
VPLPRTRILGYKSLLYGPDRDLRPGGESEFGQGSRDITLHRPLADTEDAGDGAIRFPLGNEYRRIALALG